jgi:hypothetical protein
MQQTPKPINDNLTLLDQKGALEDEIWLLAVAENFAKRRLKMATREQILESYYAEYPDLKTYVDDHVARKTCLFAIRELRKRRDKRRQAAEARRQSSLPKPARNPAFLRRTIDSRSSGAPAPITASLGNSVR